MTWPDWIWWTCRLSVRFSKNWNSLDLPSGLLWVLLWPWHGCLRQRGRVNFLEVEVLFDARTSLPPPPTRFYISAARSTNEKQIYFLASDMLPIYGFLLLFISGSVKFFFSRQPMMEGALQQRNRRAQFCWCDCSRMLFNISYFVNHTVNNMLPFWGDLQGFLYPKSDIPKCHHRSRRHFYPLNILEQ